jgi:2-methylaconitate cis-trans-isomerase PrpF
MATAAAAPVQGTVVHDMSQAPTPDRLRLGHPAGSMDIGAHVACRDGQWYADSVTTQRTARRVMEGMILVPQRYMEGKPWFEAEA